MHEPKDSHRVIRKKNKYRTVTHTCGIQKNGTDEPIYKAEMETQTDRANIQTPSMAAGITYKIDNQ